MRAHTASVCLHGRFICPGQVLYALRVAATRICLSYAALNLRRNGNPLVLELSGPMHECMGISVIKEPVISRMS